MTPCSHQAPVRRSPDTSPPLPAAVGVRFDDAEPAARDVGEVVALLEGAAERGGEGRALPRGRKDRAVDAQGGRALAYETEVEPQRGEAVGREQRLDLVDGAAEREDELLARDDGVVPHATDEDAPRRRIGPDEVAVLAAREGVRPRDRAAEPVEHRGTRQGREIADRAQAEEGELVPDLLLERHGVERERREIALAIAHRPELARWGPLREEPRAERPWRDPDRDERTRAFAPREDPPRDHRRCAEESIRPRQVAG